MDRSFIILKPDTMERRLAGTIVGRFEDAGLTIVAAKVVRPSDALLSQHYPDTLAPIIGEKSRTAGTDVGDDPAAYGRMVLSWNKAYMMRSPVLALVLEGEGVVPRVRKMIGNTNPPAADPGTIRFDYGTDSIEVANREKRGTENLVHASGSPEEAAQEIALWFPELA